MIGIYLITNKLNGKKYVGQSCNIEKRWKKHIANSKAGTKFHIHNAIKKYGVENFSFEVLEECPVDKLNEREIYWIDKFDTYNNGYNMTIGGEGRNCEAISYTKEYKRDWYRNHKDCGAKYRQEHKEKMSQYSKEYYQEHKEKIKDRSRKYWREHKDEYNEWKRKYRAKKKASKSAIINIQIEVPLW